MLKIPYQKLRLSSKGNLKNYILQGIPVLSIFALLGIMSYAIGIDVLGGSMEAAYAAGANSANASASLTIDDNTIKDNITAVRGDIAYASHNIKVNASDIASYALTITGPTNLTTTDSNGNVVSGGTTITGAGGKTGNTMNDNTWGYGWGSSNATEANLTYNSFTGAAQTLASGNANSNHMVSLDNKLVFAAKFSDNATEGHYKATVGLNLTVTPRALSALEEISLMQEMTADICDAAAVRDTATLIDARDGSDYTVAKLSDGSCWMTQNLRIVNKTISSTDSDMTSGSFTIPASSTSGFSSDTASNAYYGNNTTYGAYYTWCAATAGSCSSATTAGANATNSICPKGWKLPVGTPGTGTNDFAKAVGMTNVDIAINLNYWDTVFNPNFLNSTLTVNDVVWSAAGYYLNEAPSSIGDLGRYWSRTAYSSNSAYDFGFHSGSLYPTNIADYNRRRGFSVRCVAKEAPKFTYTVSYQLKDGHIVTNGKLPDTQIATTDEATHTFVIPDERIGIGAGITSVGGDYCTLANWLGNNGVVYKPGDSITLEANSPSLVLTTNTLMNCYTIAN